MPRPDEDGEDEDGPDDDQDDDEDASVPWAGEGYQRAHDAPPEELWLGVLPDNLVVVAVFGRCRMDVSVGMGAYYQGISAQEVRAACVLSRVRPKDWPEIVDGVQLMGRVVADIRNEQEAARSARKSGRGLR